MTRHDAGRRRLLAAAAATAGAAALPSTLFAQSRNLVGAPKHALVIGNAAYRQSPLRNPVNDAGDIGAALEKAGFKVVRLLDAGRDAMRQAIRAYGEALSKDKAVGVFYFAGHGVQLSWRNFLMPVDAEVSAAADVPGRTVDLVELVESLKRAANPANLVILDACRNNPFGRDFIVDQRGLSQMDAPTGTLLAYATAPGNVAIDGEGRNGLYTEQLLREIAVPEAKVEDVFKRVRLSVRRASKGLQVPWESTSLEDDLYFVPPKELKKLADAEREARFQEELKGWERVKGAKDVGATEEYLRRYPTGNFAPLAQVQLDRLLAAQGEKPVQVVAAPENPYTKGYGRADTAFKVGDVYRYRYSDLFTDVVVREQDEVITAITDTEVHYSGDRITDLLGNTQRHPDGRRLIGANLVPTEYSIGQRWQTWFKSVQRDGSEPASFYDLRITARERLEVPAGTFNAYRIEGEGGTVGRGNRLQFVAWIDPERCRRALKWEFKSSTGARVFVAERVVMVSFRQS